MKQEHLTPMYEGWVKLPDCATVATMQPDHGLYICPALGVGVISAIGVDEEGTKLVHLSVSYLDDRKTPVEDCDAALALRAFTEEASLLTEINPQEQPSRVRNFFAKLVQNRVPDSVFRFLHDAPGRVQ